MSTDIAGLTTLIASLLAGLGIGSVVTSLLQYNLGRKETALASQRQDLEKRYRVIILLMYAAFDFDGNERTIRINRPDLDTREAILEELKAEWHNMLLFASEKTQRALREFIKEPTATRLAETAISMRLDLGRGDLKLSLDDLKI
ncbi:MAG: hypothetical protein AAFY14_06905 [Pseudomonadota bacterium]